MGLSDCGVRVRDVVVRADLRAGEVGVVEAQWACIHAPDAVHVVPVDDLIPHAQGDCVCGPEHELIKTHGMPDAWLIVHHSLDGREARE